MNVLLVVDTSNIFNTLHRQFGNGKLDYKSFIEKLAGQDHLFHSLAFGRQTGDKSHGFITLLEKLGFVCKFTQLDKSGTNSPNVQITIDVVRLVLSGKIDKVILASSDPDILDLVHWIRGEGLVCELAACRIPKCLKDVATNSIEITSDLLLSVPCQT
ncbi:MAG: NYN domain-containing protein [Patescibacteria group bacterium]|nr:NYN domain-containing protein [Patescibacteria group bacterium]MDE2438894.1 NYN domain-containing protein [Patescibacteria group bacterium]